MRIASLLAVAALLASTLTVDAQVNRPPYADAGTDQIVDESPAVKSDTRPATVVVLSGNRSYDPDDPLGENLKVRWTLLYSTLGAPNVQTDATYKFRVINERQAQFEAPNLGPEHPSQVSYTFQAFADDKTVPTPGAPCIYLGNTYPAQMCDTVTITVRNINQDPRLQRSRIFVTPDSVDLLEDKGRTVTFQVGSSSFGCPDHDDTVNGIVTDDKSILSVQLKLTHPDDPLKRIYLDMQKVGTTCEFPEMSTWRATLPVNTPALITDTSGTVEWLVDIEVFDHDGGYATSADPEVELTEVLSVGIDASGLSSTVEFNDHAAVRAQPASCFTRGTTLPPQALGIGQVLRPEIFFADETVPSRVEGPDALLLLWKVTYQSCILSGGTPALGPEVELRSPHHLNLDTLFAGDQEVMVRFYDRMGQVFEYVAPLTEDVGRPLFFVDAPPVTYQHVAFPFRVYVQDRIDTSLRLEIKALTYADYEKVVTSEQAAYEPNAQMFFLPRLSQTVAYDLDLDNVCELLFDEDGNGQLDTAYNTMALSLTPLIPDRRGSGANRVTDYVVDLDRNGRGNAAEPVLPGHAETIIDRTDAPLCVLPFTAAEQAFLDQATTQVYEFNLTRTVIGSTTYRVTIRDLVYNQVAQNYVFQHEVGGVTQNVTQSLSGHLVTRRAETDARIVAVRTPEGPFLPGDAVQLNITVRHDAPQIPNLRIPLTLAIDEPSAPRFGSTTVVTPDTKSGNDTFVPVRAAPRDPGQHKLRFNVTAGTMYNETDRADNLRENVLVEVYLGAVSDGPWGTSKTWYIRADARGLPILKGGAVELDDNGTVKQAYDLEYRQDANGPYYQFSAPNKEGDVVALHWDPLARHSMAFNKPCGELTDAEKVLNLSAEPPKDPRCRPITVLQKSTGVAANESPAVAVGLVLVLVGFAALRRRKA